MRKVFLITIRNRKVIPLIGIIVVAIFAYGATLIVTNNYIMDDVSPNSSVKKDFEYFDACFGGVRPFELAISLKDSTDNIWHSERLVDIDRIDDYFQSG